MDGTSRTNNTIREDSRLALHGSTAADVGHDSALWSSCLWPLRRAHVRMRVQGRQYSYYTTIPAFHENTILLISDLNLLSLCAFLDILLVSGVAIVSSVLLGRDLLCLLGLAALYRINLTCADVSQCALLYARRRRSGYSPKTLSILSRDICFVSGRINMTLTRATRFTKMESDGSASVLRCSEMSR